MEGLRVETSVAVFVSNWDKEPVVGVVKKVTDDAFKIHQWNPQNLPRSEEPWTEMLQKECIIVHTSELTYVVKLQPATHRCHGITAKYSELLK